MQQKSTCFLLPLMIACVFLMISAVESRMEGHATQTITNAWILRKSYLYLLLNTLILPGLLLTSVQSAVQTFSSRSSTAAFIANIFILTPGSFFINIIIQSTFL